MNGLNQYITLAAKNALANWKASYGPQAETLIAMSNEEFEVKVLAALEDDAQWQALKAQISAETSIASLVQAIAPVVGNIASKLFLGV